jgi:AraC-like DNA-binding protein
MTGQAGEGADYLKCSAAGFVSFGANAERGDPRCAGCTVSAIAFAAGFSDLSYFNRCFRRRYGASPTELRGTRGQP